MNPEKILVIRRDNIGDLVCTTPLIHALRKRFPEARLDLLVNSYNAPLLVGHPDVDNLYVYTKAKHREKGESVLEVYWKRLLLLLRMRSTHYDVAVLANGGCMPRPLRWARQIGARYILGFSEPGNPLSSQINLPVSSPAQVMHEAEMLMTLMQPLTGEVVPTPPLSLVADADLTEALRGKLVDIAGKKLIGLHISARKPSQQWPAQRFIELAHAIAKDSAVHLMLFWSPGSADNPFHPGDDEKAAMILEGCAGLPLTPLPTHQLDELMSGLSLLDVLICSDGGAMHVAAGLGKPIVCMFGDSDVAKWHPWGVPYKALQPVSRNVVDLSVIDLLSAYRQLMEQDADQVSTEISA
ncbi:ADP-heptose--lipooligosaccharide heptosyltransferase II [Aquitalea magnusonii]|uniref:ADP-heptose--lipooligosaccharide heptosyltransferase II n=1 Tax=Aquitalea magnusonii TaxID=332411 RepID=A0A3G9GIC3_9NEIS|nr:glycosyltransferase family 9 protein [Aquitalea magnusonii]BBF87124.1 ADP-heptose--lipooligosaccharide heptosyltransferase II [Aquitalea magnusonii]